MNNLAEIRPGCLRTAVEKARPVYKRFKARYRLNTGNVTWIGETQTAVQWGAHLHGMAPRPNLSYFGQPLGGGAA